MSWNRVQDLPDPGTCGLERWCTDAHDMDDLLSVKPLKNFMKCADGQNSVKIATGKHGKLAALVVDL